MTSGLGIDKDEVEKNIYDLMIGQVGVEEVLQKKQLKTWILFRQVLICQRQRLN